MWNKSIFDKEPYLYLISCYSKSGEELGGGLDREDSHWYAGTDSKQHILSEHYANSRQTCTWKFAVVHQRIQRCVRFLTAKETYVCSGDSKMHDAVQIYNICKECWNWNDTVAVMSSDGFMIMHLLDFKSYWINSAMCHESMYYISNYTQFNTS